MAASVLCSGSALSTNLFGPSLILPKSSFLSGTNRKPVLTSSSRGNPLRRCFRSPSAKSLDHIPKQFREENLKDGLIENFKNIPPTVYGLMESQMSMFMSEDSAIFKQAENVSEESITASWNYSNASGRRSFAAQSATGSDIYSMSVRRGGRTRRPRGAPPDLPSHLLDARIVYIALPILPEVTELIVAQIMYLEYVDPSKPVYLYLNTTGTKDADNQIVGSETDAFAIADAMTTCKADVYTMNVSQAYGQAGMLFSLGKKGHRGFMPHAGVKLYLPSVYDSSGFATDMWIKGKELDANTEVFLELLAEGTGKSKEELAMDLQAGPKFLMGQQMVEYGVADKVTGIVFDAKKNYDYSALAAGKGKDTTVDDLKERYERPRPKPGPPPSPFPPRRR